jgi:hypothetical protein
MTSINKPACRQALIILGLFALFWFSWASHSRTLFNGLATPLFFALTAYLAVLATQYTVRVSPRSLFLFLLFAAWVVFVDARSGEFLPALAMDSHWFVLPLATLLIAEVFREFPIAFQAVRVGAALCIINLLLTLFIEAEWYWHWHYPPIFGHIRHLGLSVGLMTILLYSKNETTGWAAIFFRLCRTLGLALVFWSGTRASILGWACCIAVFIYADRSWAKILFLDSVVAIALSTIPAPPLPGVSGVLMRSLLGGTGGVTSIDAVTSFRLGIWQSTLFGLNEIGRLWTGVGGNGFARLQVMHGAAISYPGHIHAHNFIIQSICDWGWVGLTLLTSFFCQSTLKPVIAGRRHNDPTALGCVAYLIVTGMLDATLYHLEHLNYLAIALAYMISQKPRSAETKIIVPAHTIIALLLILVLIYTQVFDYRIGLFWYFPTQ